MTRLMIQESGQQVSVGGSGGGGGPPTGPAGGDLAGTYPDPTLASAISTGVTWSGQHTFDNHLTLGGSGTFYLTYSASPYLAIYDALGTATFGDPTLVRASMLQGQSIVFNVANTSTVTVKENSVTRATFGTFAGVSGMRLENTGAILGKTSGGTTFPMLYTYSTEDVVLTTRIGGGTGSLSLNAVTGAIGLLSGSGMTFWTGASQSFQFSDGNGTRELFNISVTGGAKASTQSATNNAPLTTVTAHAGTTAAAAGFGTRFLFTAENSGTGETTLGSFTYTWTTSTAGAESSKLVVNAAKSGSQVTVVTFDPTSGTTLETNTSTTSSADAVLTVKANTSGTAATGFGAEILFSIENGSGSQIGAGAFDMVWSTATAGSEVSKAKIKTRTGGSLVTTAQFDPAAGTTFETDTASTTTVDDGLTLVARTSGTAAAGHGVGQLTRAENGSGTVVDQCRINTTWTTATAGAEAAKSTFSCRSGGSQVTCLVLDPVNGSTFGTTTTQQTYNGGSNVPGVAKNANFTASPTESQDYEITATGKTVTLSSTDPIGTVYQLTNRGTGFTGAGKTTVTPDGGKTINGAASYDFDRDWGLQYFKKTLDGNWIAGQ